MVAFLDRTLLQREWARSFLLDALHLTDFFCNASLDKAAGSRQFESRTERGGIDLTRSRRRHKLRDPSEHNTLGLFHLDWNRSNGMKTSHCNVS
jgi:hypothetical protein